MDVVFAVAPEMWSTQLGVLRTCFLQNILEKLRLEDSLRVVQILHLLHFCDIRGWIVIPHFAMRVSEDPLMVLPPVRSSFVFAQSELLQRFSDPGLLAKLVRDRSGMQVTPLDVDDIFGAGSC